MKNLPAPALYLLILVALLVSGIGWSPLHLWPEWVFQVVGVLCILAFLGSLVPGLVIEYREWRQRRAAKRNRPS